MGRDNLQQCLLFFLMQVSIFQLLILLLICCQHVTGMQCIGQSIHLWILYHMMMWHFVCPMSSAHDTELKQIFGIKFPRLYMAACILCLVVLIQLLLLWTPVWV